MIQNTNFRKVLLKDMFIVYKQYGMEKYEKKIYTSRENAIYMFHTCTYFPDASKISKSLSQLPQIAM